MGCISSKVITRTLSLHEESNKSNSGFPLLEDVIKSAQSSSDQYIELVLHPTSFGSNAPSKLTTNDETDSSETTVKLEEDNQQEKHKIVTDDQIEGSEGLHLILPDHVLSSLVQEDSSGVENKYELADAGFVSTSVTSDGFKSELDQKIMKENNYDLNSKGDVGIRSFHTVEEYDDLVRKLMLSKSLWFTDKDDPCSSGTTIDQDSVIKDIMQAKTIAPREKHDVSIEKGYKRKAIARRLESLKIPSLCNIYAPGTYVTPKFGSYSSFMAGGSENNSCIFAELVSELEQSMQILEEEEESILKQMESSEENDRKIMDPQERHP